MISKRLLACMRYCKGFKCLADIGCDHAYVPIHAILNGYVEKAIGIDNKKGPLEAAKENISKNNLEDEISLCLSNGIEEIENADVVLIAGMGGLLISSILEEGEKNLKCIKRLILAPNTDSIYVRKCINRYGFIIIHEEVVLEKNHFYEIIVCEKGKVNYSEMEYKYGPILLKTKPKEFLEMINYRKKH